MHPAEQLSLIAALAGAVGILWKVFHATTAARFGDLTARMTRAESRLDECEEDRSQLRDVVAKHLQQSRPPRAS